MHGSEKNLRPPVFELQFPKEAKFLMKWYRQPKRFKIWNPRKQKWEPSYFPKDYLNLC